MARVQGLSQVTVRATDRDGVTRYVVVDALGREQGYYPTIREAVARAEGVCRYGWPLELVGHTAGSDCDADHTVEVMDATGNPHPLDNDRDPLNWGRCTRCGDLGCRCDAFHGGA